jgi:hypothetical protein
MQSALQNQQTGATAGGALGNVGAQGITAGLTTGAAQMNAPFQGATNYANLINSINAPATVSQQTQLSPLQMVSTLANAPNVGSNLLNSIFGKGSGVPGQSGYIPPGLLATYNNLFGGNSSTNMSDVFKGGGTGTIVNESGQVVPDPTYGNTSSSSVMQNPDYNPYENPI